jgi:hypothetical protein
VLSIEKSDSAPAIVLKIERGVAALGEEVSGVAPYLRALLSVDPGDAEVTYRPGDAFSLGDRSCITRIAPASLTNPGCDVTAGPPAGRR